MISRFMCKQMYPSILYTGWKILNYIECQFIEAIKLLPPKISYVGLDFSSKTDDVREKKLVVVSRNVMY